MGKSLTANHGAKATKLNRHTQYELCRPRANYSAGRQYGTSSLVYGGEADDNRPV